MHRPVAILVVLAAAVVLRLVGINGDLADHDTWRQTETATQARNFVDDARILWPRVDWGEPGPGYVEAEFQLLPWTVSLLYRVGGEHPVYGRLLNVLLFLLSCWPLQRLARRFLDATGTDVALAIYALSPLVFRYSRAFMPDTAALLFALVACERFVAHLETGRRRTLLAAGAAMALAILVKPTSIHLGLPLAFLALHRHGGRMFARADMWGFAALALLPAAAYYWHAATIHRDFGNTFGVISGGDSKWGGPVFWFAPSFYRSLVTMDVLYGPGPLGAGLAAAGLLLDRNRQPRWRVLVRGWILATAIYYFAVARYAGDVGMGLHYHIYAAPLYAMLAGAGCDSLLRRRWLPGLVTLLLVLLALVDLGRRDLETLRMANPVFMQAGQALAAASQPDDRVLVLSTDPEFEAGIPNNFQLPDVFFHSHRKGRVLPSDAQTPEDAQRLLLPTMRWFVNFPFINRKADYHADPRFLPWLAEHFERVAGNQDWEVWRRR
jgi:4-amino-4-deoxy-L-arabinose transferase-like glycosyltransferase